MSNDHASVSLCDLPVHLDDPALRASARATLVPLHELARSPAAARVGLLAADSGLFNYHFEHRALLPVPESWLADGHEDDVEPPSWDAGVLPEPKYQSFRHDLLIGSYHPAHRAKWATHELCHGLVGFAWRANAPPLFHATASRLAELLPVALWYFFDEVRLRRCSLHAGHGPLFRVFCPDCELAAVAGAAPEQPAGQDRRLEEGRRFIERELAAVATTRRTGAPFSHRWGSIDLCSDGLAYGRAHGYRLTRPSFERFATEFLVPGGGWSADLDALEGRVLAVAAAIVDGAPLAPLAPTPAHGRTRWAAQDLAQRLLQVQADIDGAASRTLDALVDDLAAFMPLTTAGDDPTPQFEALVCALRERYQPLYDDSLLPSPDLVFGVGYPLAGGLGRCVSQVRDGLRTVVPVTLDLADDVDLDLVTPFVAADTNERVPLGVRFARWMSGAHPGPAASLAAWESALRRAGVDSLVVALGEGGDGPVRLAENVAVVQAPFDVAALAERAEEGSVQGLARDGRLLVEPAPAPEPMAWLIGKDAVGELVLAEVEPDIVAALVAAGSAGLQLDSDVGDALSELGLVRPLSWPLL